MRNSQIVEHLANVPLFVNCTKKDLQSVVRHCETLKVDGNTEIVCQGNEGSAFYLLLEGTADVRRNNRRVAQLEAGDFFGELALLDPAPRNATVTSTSPVQLLALTTRMFNVAMRDLPRLRRGLLSSMATRLRDLDWPA